MIHVAKVYFQDHASSFPAEIPSLQKIKRMSIQVTFVSHPVNNIKKLKIYYLFSK